MADEKYVGRYSPITSEPVLTLEELAKRNKARAEEKERAEAERKRREERLRADAVQQAKDKKAPDEQNRRRPAPLQRREDGEWRRESTAPEKPTTVTRDNVTVPLEEAVAKIPQEMAFEQRVLSSPLRDRALRRARTEELIADGKSPEEAAQIAQKEQEDRQKAFEAGRARARAGDGKGASGFVAKESSDLATDLVYGGTGLVARAIGANQTADELQAFVEGSHAETADWRNENSPYPQVQSAVSGAANSLVQMVPGVAASAVAGPGVGMGVMAAQFGGQEYNRAMYEGAESGLAGDQLNRYAQIQGGIEASIMPIMSKIPGMAGLEGKVLRQSIARGVANNPKVRQAIASGALNFTKESAAEVTEEVLTEALHGFAAEKILNERQDYATIFKDTILQTLLTMGLTEGGQRIGGAISDRMTPEQATPGTMPPSTPTPDPATTAAATQAAESVPVDEAAIEILNRPAVQEFLNKPQSARTYEAAVKAGMPPIQNPNRENRARHAEDLRRRLADPVSQPAAQLEPAAVDRQAIESPSGTVPDVNVVDVQNGGSNRGQEIIQNTEDQQVGQEVGYQGTPVDEGRQEEELLTPAGTPNVTTPADSRIPPANHTRESFEKEYTENFIEMSVLPPDSPEYQALESRMADLYDAHPDWAQNLETTQPVPSVVGQTESGPGQSSPPATGPVSSEPEAASGQSQKKDTQPETAPNEPRRGVIGDMLSSGEVVKTASGRSTTPFPKYSIDSPRKTNAVFKKVEEWLQSNALAEAESRGDDFNATQFRNEKPGSIPPASKAAMEEYLFGEQPKVVPSIFKTDTSKAATPTPSEPATTPVPSFAALPQKSQDLFNKAFESRDVESLKQMVQKNNVAWNSEFTNRTGIKLPKNLKDRYRAVTEWANPTPTYGKRSEIPKWGIYQTLSQGKPKFSVKEADNDTGFGDSLHDTAEEAKKYADIGRQRETEKAEAAAKRQAAEEADQKKQQEHEASFQGFLTDDPMVKGRRLKTLDTLVNYEKQPISRKALVEKRVADGWTVNDKDQLQAPTGEFLDVGALTKTGIDYARHLISKNSESEKAKAPATTLETTSQAENQAADATPAESQSELTEVEQATLNDLMDLLAPNQTPVKAAKKPRTPKAATGSQPQTEKKPRSKIGQKTAKAKADSDAEVKALYQSFVDDMKGQKIIMLVPGAPVMNPKAIASAVRLTAGLAKNGVVTFADFATLTIENIGAELATKLAPYLETAWTMLKRVPGYENVDPAGNISDYLPQASETQSETVSEPPARTLVDLLETELLTNRGIEAKKLWELADKAYGGTRAEGKYGPSEAYDALETAINLTILDARAMGLKTPAGQVSPEIALKNLLEMQKQIVSQTNRSGTKDTMQQFSTPPAYSYVVSQFVNMDARDVVLEPSAGTGDLAVHALNQRAKVHVNELDPKRAEMLKAVQESSDDRLTISTEDALQLGNIMGPNLRPSVVLMNPPFSREGQRMGDLKMSGNDRNHIDAAMGSLIDGGRLVAIIGAGLHGPSKGFTNWLAETAKKHNVRANIEVSRDVYKGYGTTFPTRVLVIDKGTPTPKDGTLTAQADSLEQLLTMTKGIRNDRNRGTIQPVAPGQNVPENAGTNEGGNQPQVPDRSPTAAIGSGKPNGNASKRPAKVPKPASGTGGRNVANDTGGRPDAADSQGTGSQPSGGSKPVGAATTDAAGEPTGNLAGKSPEPRRVAEKRTEIDESVLFESYQPSIVPFPNAKPHPTAAVESAAMAAVEYPEVTEIPNIDPSIIEDGRLSDVQLEFVALAAHAHNQILPNEERTGILFGDGTGMGKGRGIPGVILHNWNEGRRKAIWVSKNGKLHSDAMQEWEELGGNPAQVANLTDMPVDDAIDLTEGILFATYDTLKSSGKSGKTRAQQVIDWLPEDFDGVIAFDEAHLMGSDTAARAGVARDLQDKFPKARVVYASATAATEIDQLMFGSRLGLWGAATPFATAREFAAKIGAAGVSAMESVALSLKAMGRYVSRSISFNDGTPDGTVGYKRLNHTLADHQVKMYDRLADAWQKVIGEFEDAMDVTEADSRARGFARGQFWSAHQRFFNDLVTSLQMPTVIESIEKDMAEGRSVVIQLTTTGAAQQARALAGRGTESLDDFSVDPFASLVELVRTQFPTQAYEDYMKDDGSIGKRRVVDSEGKPVKDAAAVAKQQALLADLADMEQSMPESPIDMILNYFGIENVAEVTGRNQRVVWQEQQDGTKKRVLEKRSQKKSNQADIDAFQEGKKRILIFSQAGGTGASYHADRRARNQQKRMHYLVQPGWVAADAIQGLGRTHRTNQKQAPEYVLVQTDIPGQKRFISTIARRLTQLGALTRGQRTAGGGGVFDASDNLESTEAALALTEFFKSLEKDDAVMSLDEFEQQTGLELRLPSTGAMKADGNLPDITSFMNRMLSMKVDSQNKVFDEFDRILKTITEARRISGELDQGVETIKGTNIRKTRDEVVFTHDSGAKTKYVQLTMDVPIPSRDFEKQSKAEKYKDFVGYYRRKSDGKVFFVNESFAKTSKSGQVVDMVRLVPPFGETLREEAYKLNTGSLEEITPREAESLWNEQFGNRPKSKSQKVDMITGAVLPVWDRLPQLQPKLSRALTADGDVVLGVVLPPSKVNETLGKLGAEKNKVDVGETVSMLRTGKGDVQLVNGWKIERVRVQNEWRLEIVGPNPVSEIVFQRQGVIIERIGFKARYFIPFGENTQTVFDAVTRGNPVQKVNRYDSADTSADEETDAADTPDPATQPAEAGAAETDAQRLRREAETSKEELRKLQEMGEKYSDTIEREFRNMPPLSVLVPIPVTKEMASAIAGLALVKIRSGVKRFEVLIRELRARHAEGVLLAMKPNLIAVWNSMRPKFGLEDTATDAGFDIAIAAIGDADLQQATEAAIAATSPTAPTPPAATPDPAIQASGTTPQGPAPLDPDSEEEPEKTYSLQNASTDFERQKMGLPKRPENSGPKWAAMANVAKGLAETDYGRKQVDTLIADLEARPRATTPIEHFQLLQRYAEVDQKYEDAMEERNAAKRIGDDAQEAISEREMLLFEGQKLQLMNIESGQVSYLLGAGLAARKAEIKRDFTIERMIMEYEAAFGKEPTDAQKESFREQIAKYKAGMKALQKLIDERDAKINDLETRLKEAHDAAVDAASSVTPKVSAAKKRAQEKISERWKAISALLGKTYSIETALAQGTKAFIDLAGAYVELGVVSLADYLNRVRKRMGPDAEPLIPQFTEGYNEYMKSVASSSIDDVTGKIDPNDDETIGKAVRDLHRMVIQRDGLNASAEGRNAAVVAVHRIIEQIIPGITEEQVARAMSGIGVYAELNKDEIEVIRRDQKAQLLLLEQIRDWNRKQAPPATGVERPPVSDEQRALRKAVNEAKKAAGIVTRTEGQLRSALDAAKRLVRNRISDLNKALEPDGKPIERSKRVSPTDPELDALRAERDDLQKQYDAVFGKNQMSDEQRLAMAEKMMDKAIANLENDLAAGKLYADPKKPPVSSPALEAKREQLDALKASREEMRIQSGESQARSDAAFERHLLARGAELARRIAEKDFAPAPKPEARELTPAMLKQMMANQKMEQEFINQKRDWEFKNRHPIYKAWHNGPVQAMGMIRKGLTTIDQSLIGRQGWLLGITHPLIYGKAIKNAFGSNWVKGKSIFPTEQDIFNTEAALDADASWVRIEKIGKLAVTGVHGGLKKTEENLSDVPAWFDKIPGIGGSERAGSAFINSQRRMVFRELVTQLARWQGKDAASLSSADLRVIGNLVNVSTGRASLGKLENAAQVATALFFSPRWWASRLQMMAGVPMWHNSSWFGGEGASKEVRMLVAREWTGQMAAQVAIMTIVVSALKAAFGEPGDDEKWDWFGNPQSPNFGRLRIGSTYIDMTAGLGAHVSMLARMITGKQVNRWETEDVERWNTFTNYVRSKLAPMPGIGADWMKGRSIGGEQFGSPEWVASKTVPLSFQDIRETFKGEGPILGSIVSTMMFFGFSAQTHEARVNARKDLANEVRAMKKQGKSPEVIQKAIDDHLNNAAKLEARQQLRVADPEQKPALEKIIAGEASGELEDAKTKERFDIVTRAAEMLSSESGGFRKSVDDPGIKAARDILKAIAPTEEEAVELYNAAYRRSYGSTMEVVDKRLRPKRNVVAARRRIRALYAP